MATITTLFTENFEQADAADAWAKASGYLDEGSLDLLEVTADWSAFDDRSLHVQVSGGRVYIVRGPTGTDALPVSELDVLNLRAFFNVGHLEAEDPLVGLAWVTYDAQGAYVDDHSGDLGKCPGDGFVAVYARTTIVSGEAFAAPAIFVRDDDDPSAGAVTADFYVDGMEAYKAVGDDAPAYFITEPAFVEPPRRRVGGSSGFEANFQPG